jgi:peptidyl-prolyl cis-trans isomerase C
MEERLSETVSDESVKRLYERQSDVSRLGEEVRARQIVVASGEEAESILAALNAGGAFENVARELSLDKSTSGTGGDLGYFSRDQVDPAIAAAAFSIAIGAYSRPVQTEHGWHVLQVLDKRRSDAIPLSTVEDGIRKFLRMRTIEATILKLKQDKDVVYYGDTGSSPAPHLRDGSTGGGS